MTRPFDHRASWPLTLALLALSLSARATEEPLIDLAGTWSFRLDPNDQGITAAWWQAALLPDRIQLPGALQSQGFGHEITLQTDWTGQIVDRSWFESPAYAPYRQPENIMVPFWLQPLRHYVGPAWYQRTLDIPADWANRRLTLFLERPHWETRVWLDDQPLGRQDSLSTPHAYDLGHNLKPGPRRLTIRVDNRLVVDVGSNSHSVSDHTQGNWNGIVGRLELRATPQITVEDLRITPDAATRSARIEGRIASNSHAPGQGKLTIKVTPPSSGAANNPLILNRDITWQAEGGTFSEQVELGPDAQLWDEFQPALYRVSAQLDEGPAHETRFGLRSITTRGNRLLLNGHPIFLRGTLECCIFPKTGYPPTDVASWKRLLGIARDHGLNHLRFHSYCPPEAAFVAADEMGFYYQVEAATWPNASTTLGDGKPVDAWLEAETARIIATYGNHPSFLLMASGNEPGGNHYKEYLTEWANRWKSRDNRRLFTSASGWPMIPENQYHVTPDPRIQAWGQGLASRINAAPPETTTDYRAYIQQWPAPVVSHEIGQWCAYPNFDEIPSYTGPLKPRNFEIFRDSLAAHGMLPQAHDFLIASGKLQALCYKEEVESALRTPGMAGFALLALQDFPGQGTALVGVLDPFWNQKGYVTPDQFQRFCAPTVPLARLPKRVFTTAETLTADLEAAHFGPADLPEATPQLALRDDQGRTLWTTRLTTLPVPRGELTALGHLEIPLADLPAPARYRLILSLAGSPIENDWDIWLYPPSPEASTQAQEVVRTQSIDDTLLALEAGKRVLWSPAPGQVRNDPEMPVLLGFSSIFWNTAWTRRQAPTTLGILCDPAHPSLSSFPTDAHSNWQWWYLIHRAAPLLLDDLPANLPAIVQVIDDWFTNRRLALVVEAKVGAGRLLISSIDLQEQPDEDPVIRQFRASLLDYADSDLFNPAVALTPQQLRSLIKPAR